jgi:hypothetical protein
VGNLFPAYACTVNATLPSDPIVRVLSAGQRRFVSHWFYAAAIYNLVWGVAVILFPRVWFRLGGIELPQPDWLAVQFWQCIGMFVMVFAIGYYYAGRDPERYAPFILIGFLGKVFGPIGFVWGWWHGQMPATVGLVNVTNDLIWLPVFGWFVWKAMVKRGTEARKD